MAENESFNTKIIMAGADREQWYNSVQLPKIQDDYRLHLSCVRNIFDALVKRGLITPDPYKKENKITSIQIPDTTPFNDNERSQILGIRLSNYESVIDYVCNYMRFSVEMLSIDVIKKMLELNNSFTWTNLSLNSTRSNTRALATVINELKNNVDQLTLSMIKDNTLKTQNAITEICTVLKELAEFQRERYKLDIRKNILENSGFDKEKAYSSTQDMVNEIKRLFPSSMPKRPLSAELVAEVAAEETAPNKAELQATLLAKIKIPETTSETKTQKIDTHAILMEALRLVGTTYDSYKVIYDKITANHEVLQNGRKSFKVKFIRLLRSIFGLDEPPVDYEVLLTDKKTEAKKKETVHYNEFSAGLLKRVKIYSAFAMKDTPGYNKISQQKDEAILEYLNKQITENNHLFALVIALDEYFKNNVDMTDRSKIKGCSMELTTIKNILVKANQQRSDYIAYAEEAEQMKKLGI
ncbi:hypothetical protein [Treponema sp.]|uniref:hypothetical protein n=1 Tax=Treponema sp. TaxID=166 RepID=UPI00298E1BC6|nr:hypothetical protein [Treponema sp.]MCQ2240800.1 hypothetical protein [Treponema sp.]